MNTVIINNIEGLDVAFDTYVKLSESRILFLSGLLTDSLASDLCACILYLDSLSEEKITLFINSEGGDIRNIFMLYDTMRLVASPIETVCVGSAADEISLILAAGTKGMRFATKNSYISLSQLFQNKMYMTDLTDAKILLEQAKEDNKRFIDVIASCTSKKSSILMKDFERKKYLTASQAKSYGFIDKIVGSK